jgi:hypothetical protein
MFCKWCGMESVTTDQCSWCHRPFTTTAETTATKSAESKAETSVVETEPTVVLAGDAVSAPPVAATTETAESEPTEVKAPWDNAPAPESTSTPEPAAPKVASASPPPVIGVRRRSGAHVPAPAMPPRAASAASGQSATRSPVPAPAAPPGMAPRRPGSSAPGRPHTPAPPIPAAAARSGAAPAAPIANRTVETPQAAAAPPTAVPASTSRTALPSSLLGGARTTAPLADSVEPPPAVEGGLADGVAIPPAVSSATDANVPQIGLFTPAKSKYYAGQVVDPVSGTHYDADTGKPTATAKKPERRREDKEIEFNWDTAPVTMGKLVARFLGVFAILLAAGSAIAYLAPAAYVVPLLLVNFIGGLLLPVMRAVPWQDEDSDDVFLMIVLTLAFGPIVSLVIYSVLTAVRQDGNPAMLGVMGVAALTRIGIGMATGTLSAWWQLMPFPLTGWSATMMFVNWAGLVALVGWYFGNIFHKFDE